MMGSIEVFLMGGILWRAPSFRFDALSIRRDRELTLAATSALRVYHYPVNVCITLRT